VRLYREFFREKGWPPDRLNDLTPGQLRGIAGGGGDEGRTFGSIAEAAAAYRREHGDA
jgi:hypothetical protein